MKQDELSEAPDSHRRTARHEPRAGANRGAESSNTAPLNCTILRRGIDSLYLSFKGELSEEGSIRLEEARKAARADTEAEQALAQISILDHLFESAVSGGKLFKYRLRDHAYSIQLRSKKAKNLPLAVCQIASHYLTGAGVESAVNELRLILSCLGVLDAGASVTRLDLFVDFVAPCALDSWPDEAWVTRAKFQDRHRVGGQFTGWSIGRGVMLARLYDKTLQIKASGQDYLRPMWREKGWDGESRVYRLEFQFRNQLLRELSCNRYPEVLDKLGGLWNYAARDWLRLTLPNDDDKTRTRWPTHPMWSALQNVAWDGAQEAERMPVMLGRAPSDEKLCGMFFSSLTSFMGAKGLTDPYRAALLLLDDTEALYERLGEFNGEGFYGHATTRAAKKALQYRIPYPGMPERAQELQDAAVAAAYRKASGR